MKNLKYLVFAVALTGIFTGCDEDTELPFKENYLQVENFKHTADNTTLVIDGWLNYASEGSVVWKQQIFQGDGYAEFNSFGSPDLVNVGWLISKKTTIPEGVVAYTRLKASHSFLSDPEANKLEILVSNDFDGTPAGVENATWTELTPTALPSPSNDFYEYVDLGEMSLAGFTGDVYVAIRVTGSGTDFDLDGAYQVDSFRIYIK